MYGLLICEIVPYWARDQISVTWASSDDRTDAALFGVMIALRLFAWEDYTQSGAWQSVDAD
jgi:hypothetical protein